VVAVAAAAGVRLEAVDGRRVTVSGGADRTVRVWDARSGNHRRIEVHAQAHGIVTTEELIVVATSLGLAPSGSRRPPMQQSSAINRNAAGRVKRSTITRSSEVAPSTAL
jgi:WD40 repeat protein